MTTTAELIRFLKQFPEDTNVEVLQRYEDRYGEEFQFTPLNVYLNPDNPFNRQYNPTWEYIDFAGNQNVVVNAPHYNKKFLYLGSKD